jgi:peptide/nickel transport system ATP-binding protein
MSLISVNNLSIQYGDSYAVRDLSFSIEPGEAVGLVGESGSGKSQTALAMLGLLPAGARTSGEVVFADTNLLTASERKLDQLRAEHIAIVFQDPRQALNPYVSIGRQLRRILIQHGLANGNAAKERVMQMLRRVGLPDPERQYDAFPHQLSGGMRQRAMIASALLCEPDLLIADEPTTALDVTVQAQILDLLEELRKETTLLLITHDLGIVAGHCERMLVLEKGHLVEQGLVQAVFAAPQHQHTQALLAAARRFDRPQELLAPNGEAVFSIEDASVSYKERDYGELHAVRDVGLSLQAGETLAIVGESGSGKSSLIKAALGLVPLRSGSVTFLGEPLDGPVQARALDVRRDLQLVFQDPVGSLNPQMRIEKIVAEPLTVHDGDSHPEGRQLKVVAALGQVGLGKEFLRRFPHELSGGQAQRVAIARALILQPKVLLCDEAVAALDGSVREQVLGILAEEQRRSGLAVIFITHDLAVVRAIANRVLVMYMGRLVELAGNETLFARTRHPYTRALIDAVPAPDPMAVKRSAPLPGEVPSILHAPPGCAFHTRCTFVRDVCSVEVPQPRQLDGTLVACHRAEEI